MGQICGGELGRQNNLNPFLHGTILTHATRVEYKIGAAHFLIRTTPPSDLAPMRQRFGSYSAVAARNPAMTIAAITVNQMSSAGMTEIMTVLARRY